MLREGDVVPVFGPGGRFVRDDRWRVLAVGGDDERRRREDALEGALVVDQHVAGAGPHEDLDAARQPPVDRLDRVQVVVGRAKVEPVVGHRPGGGSGVLILERAGRHRLRVAVRHLQVARDTAGDGGARFGCDRGLMLEPRLAEMHLVVDHAGQQVGAGRVDDLGATWRRHVHPEDAPPGHRQVAHDHGALVDDLRVDDVVAHRPSLRPERNDSLLGQVMHRAVARRIAPRLWALADARRQEGRARSPEGRPTSRSVKSLVLKPAAPRPT